MEHALIEGVELRVCRVLIAAVLGFPLHETVKAGSDGACLVCGQVADHADGIVVEDGHLLAFVRPDAGVTVAGNEHAIVADHNGENAVLKVVGEQADVTQSMVFAASRASEDHEVAPAVFAEPAHGFCQVVGLLFADADKDSGIAFCQVGGDRVAVADDEVGYDTNVVKALDGSVAAYAERGALHPGLKAFPTGKFPGCHYDGIRTVGLQVEDGG